MINSRLNIIHNLTIRGGRVAESHWKTMSTTNYGSPAVATLQYYCRSKRRWVSRLNSCDKRKISEAFDCWRTRTMTKLLVVLWQCYRLRLLSWLVVRTMNNMTKSAGVGWFCSNVREADDLGFGLCQHPFASCGFWLQGFWILVRRI